jgi:hypothetical protein
MSATLLRPRETCSIGEDPEPGAPASGFRCALCGGRFEHGERSCGACPLLSGCDLVRCPHCGYQFPRSSRLVDWLRERFGGRRRTP